MSEETHRYWLHDKDQIIDCSAGREETALDCNGTKIVFAAKEYSDGTFDDHCYRVFTMESGQYLCDIDDRDTLPTIRKIIEDSMQPTRFTAQVKKIGNSNYILIPKHILDDAPIFEGDKLEIGLFKH